MNNAFPPVVIGAGPAGVRAAQTLVEHGLHPIVIDESPRAGGQIYRQQPPHFQRTPRQIYGFDARAAQAVHQTFEQLTGQIDYRPSELAWGADEQALDLWNAHSQKFSRVPWRQVIIATGATDRILPFPGWTLPGVYSLGGAQVALKYQGCSIGRKVVLAGSGPLLYLLAWQYRKAGVDVRAVLDYADSAQKMAALPALSKAPKVLMKGLYFIAWLRSQGVALHSGARILSATGETQVSGLRWQSKNHPQRIEQIDCDAVAFGYGLRSETQLADLFGCEFDYSTRQRAWLPRQQQGASSKKGVYLAGDGAGILGAAAAELSGERAALRLLQQADIPINNRRLSAINQRLDRFNHFARGLDNAFPFPDDWASSAPDDTIICRCEQVSAGEIRRTIAETGCREINQLKAFCRSGMGRCQGRMCGIATAELLASTSGQSTEQSGRLRAQIPIKPIPVFTAEKEHD
ncbi:NAD(P)/FAD-dependent oxidoreductase [Serratia sp. M24T3]|uniref:FAD/NAD(P)-dependent oxidoreductase n=1 Tax=Serratia sp. M24T3 TaxID=932213 RepID=UPI00025B912F|nr:NAD(P)/FAD-dependent oxidoreductase [Serratia sp. M24T3]EIC84315.1 BFD-like protein (2Fe-2S)-binding protein [Serratia sp. M24T3]